MALIMAVIITSYSITNCVFVYFLWYFRMHQRYSEATSSPTSCCSSVRSLMLMRVLLSISERLPPPTRASFYLFSSTLMLRTIWESLNFSDWRRLMYQPTDWSTLERYLSMVSIIFGANIFWVSPAVLYGINKDIKSSLFCWCVNIINADVSFLHWLSSHLTASTGTIIKLLLYYEVGDSQAVAGSANYHHAKSDSALQRVFLWWLLPYGWFNEVPNHWLVELAFEEVISITY